MYGFTYQLAALGFVTSHVPANYCAASGCLYCITLMHPYVNVIILHLVHIMDHIQMMNIIIEGYVLWAPVSYFKFHITVPCTNPI